MALDEMSIETYWEIVEPRFVKTKIEPPKRIHERYFNLDGSPTQSLLAIAQEADRISSDIGTNRSILEQYIFGTYATGMFWDGSDLDIGMLMHCTPEQARDYQNTLNDEIRHRYPAREGEDAKPGYTIYPVHIHVHIVKPYGSLFDLKENRWITFGKRESDHHDFEWAVLGLRVD